MAYPHLPHNAPPQGSWQAQLESGPLIATTMRPEAQIHPLLQLQRIDGESIMEMANRALALVQAAYPIFGGQCDRQLQAQAMAFPHILLAVRPSLRFQLSAYVEFSTAFGNRQLGLGHLLETLQWLEWEQQRVTPPLTDDEPESAFPPMPAELLDRFRWPPENQRLPIVQVDDDSQVQPRNGERKLEVNLPVFLEDQAEWAGPPVLLDAAASEQLRIGSAWAAQQLAASAAQPPQAPTSTYPQ